ncbi:zinc finger, c3HC4 type (RING finger) domain-containing protein [Sarocladium implicatum]|nr:zinc finger, c3HC4 type (RING finger) domain-containing protein [Sarocladium implicatum]
MSINSSKNPLHIGFDDYIPDDLISGLLKLPSEEPAQDRDEDHGPPSPKRRRLNGASSDSLCVCSESITFFRRAGNGPQVVGRRQGVGRQVKLDYSPALKQWQIRGTPFGRRVYALSIKEEDMPWNWHVISEAARRQGPGKAGDIWSQISVDVKRDHKTTRLTFSVRVMWNPVASPYHNYGKKPQRNLSSLLLSQLYPLVDGDRQTSQWSPMDFYDAAYVPPKEDTVPNSIEIPQLEASLYPFQKHAVQWALRREGVEWSPDTCDVRKFDTRSTPTTSALFRRATDLDGQPFFVSDVLKVATRDIAPFAQAEAAISGGILSEEMGLGKTLEVISLILLHQRSTTPKPLLSHPSSHKPSGATLIVAPASLRRQWLTELAKHAPSLRVHDYKGCKHMSQREYEEAAEMLAKCDVVITTYAVLTAEVHFARPPPDRSRRLERKYERKESPLVKISWWRLCLDEAQMIENGFGQAAQVAHVIPRYNGWAITGTPVKDAVQDLFGLLIFLRYEPFCSYLTLRQALVSDTKTPFHNLFNSIALRHTKALVRDQLKLPRQKRYVISIPFTPVEEQLYQSLFREMADACGLDEEGGPLLSDWTPESHVEEMRMWLNRLRQTALHPEVGAQNRRALGNSKSRPLRTVDEVLDAMLDQSDNAMKADERAYLSSKLTRGQLFENSPRVREALEIWLEVRKEVRDLVVEAREGLRQAIAEAKTFGTGSEEDAASDFEGGSSDEESDETDTRGRIGECRRRLRFALEMLHKAVFFCANAHFQIRDNAEMTDPESEEHARLKALEDEGYEEAKMLRREILKQSHRRATRLMESLSDKASRQTFTEIPELACRSERGIESSRIVDDLEDLYGRLNEQANVVDEWREHLIQLLLKPLLDEEDEAEFTGEELADSTKLQDELMVYVTALRAAIADRQDAISGQSNELIRHETLTSIRYAKDGNGPAPEKLLELLEIRARANPRVEGFSMRSALSQFRTITVMYSREAGGATQRTVAEHKIATLHLESTQDRIKQQNKAATSLESEIEDFRAAMNARVEFYRQLQAVSDSVLPYDGPSSELTALTLQKAEDDHLRKLAQGRAKHRYLLNLKSAGAKSTEPRMCVICQSSFTTGVLTVCGHQFCKECMMMWFKHRHNCPTCKRRLSSSDLHDITMQPRELKVHGEGTSGGTAEEQSPTSAQKMRANGTTRTGIYSEFNADKLAEIKNVPLDGPSFTTKVDALIQHLLWLRETDPGAKTIMFSQYKDFLVVLRTALTRYRIGFASIDDANGITTFTTDPSVEVFLLHARAHSSGLNLVNANHVFLCEPLLNTALELQAIARVDRIGQQHETTVWLYLISGTVEESIHELSVQRRMQHMARDTRGRLKDKGKESTPELLDAKIEEANTLEMEHASLSKLMSKDRGAGEMVDKGDLWECLFGHVARGKQAAKQDNRLQEQAVIGYLAAEAAEARRDA